MYCETSRIGSGGKKPGGIEGALATVAPFAAHVSLLGALARPRKARPRNSRDKVA